MKTILCGAQLANGKDLLCDYLAQKLNERHPETKWVRNAFANAVKKVFENAFGVDREWIEKYKRDDEPPEGFLLNVRNSLITIGDGFRKMRSGVWIENAFRNQQANQIISDGRYVNEAVYNRKLNGINILLWRPGFENDINSPSEQEYVPYVRYLRDRDFPDGCISVAEEVPASYWRHPPKKPFLKMLQNYFDLFVAYRDNCYVQPKPKIPKDRTIPFDLWIKNDGTKENLFAKIDKFVIPYIEEKMTLESI